MRRLVARLDNLGDVLLAGPAVRAAAATADELIFLAGPSGAEAARMLPAVDEVLVFDAPWVSFDPPATDGAAMSAFVQLVADRAVDEAVILTSFHQSPLPLALLLRCAGVPRLGATSVDYPGSLLDVRMPYAEDLHEVEQSLALCAAMGYRLPPGDDTRLLLAAPGEVAASMAGWNDRADLPAPPYVVVHPGASVPARSLPSDTTREVVAALVASGRQVVVTGSADEVDRARAVVPPGVGDRVHLVAGRTSLAGTADVLAAADVVVCGNTGIVHLAAAVGTPVVELFAPVVAPDRWRPWRVPHVLLGELDVGCAGCRARRCPFPEQLCVAGYDPESVLTAVEELSRTDVPQPVEASA
jgi:ADP-heptose:LPS heptosyltransferase